MSKEPNRRIVTPNEYNDMLNIRRDTILNSFWRRRLVNVGGNYLRVELKTDCKKLIDMWETNYPAYSGNPELTVEVYSKGENLRLYDKENRRMLITGNDYYGCVKFGYRVIISDILRHRPPHFHNNISFHSAALVINGHPVIITGPSGAGKNTTMNHLDRRYDGLFLWDDWGVIKTTGWIPVPNEESYHMSEASASVLVPGFNCNRLADILYFYPEFCKKAGFILEERAKRKYMVPLHVLRKTAKNSLGSEGYSLAPHSLVILTNDPNSTVVRKVDAEEALEVFSKPAWSYAWECFVPFMNEHLMMTDDELKALKEQYRETFKNIPNIILANNNKQEADKQKFLEDVKKLVE